MKNSLLTNPKPKINLKDIVEGKKMREQNTFIANNMVYIDNFNATYGRMKMCHMIADTTQELLDMCDKIGVVKKWIQYPGTANEHFDICLAKKTKAISFGAIEIGFRDYAKKVNERDKTKK